MSEIVNVAEIFGKNVFNETVMKERLPKSVFKKMKKTIEDGAELDPSIADVVAHAMKDWAIERGATHYTHWFQPLTGVTAEQHDSFISAPDAEGAHQGRAGCILLPVRRPACYLRGKRLYRMGLHFPGLFKRRCLRRDSLHSDRVLLLHW